ncbi:MAG: hypothetical protein H7834_06945 [Magnetococcus sp. YQC-9]
MTLARSSKEAFFAPFAKNAPRAAFAGVVSAFWKRLPHLARSLARNYASQNGCGLKEAPFAKHAPRAALVPWRHFAFFLQTVSKKASPEQRRRLRLSDRRARSI